DFGFWILRIIFHMGACPGLAAGESITDLSPYNSAIQNPKSKISLGCVMDTNNETVDLGASGSEALIGRTLQGKYRIEELLGTGGMCDVYRGTHIHRGKQVAIKILKPQLAVDPAIARRFEQEARAASRIHHPNAINVMDYGIGEGNTPFIVMEYV